MHSNRPGFPTAQGFALCANPPASGGNYPAPSYGYTPGGAPAGAGGDFNALGFAFSEGQAAGYWNGQPGQFTADQAAVAAKLLYDTVVWGTPVPSMDPGVNAAFNAFAGWFNEALGMAASPPQLSVGLVGGGNTFTTSAVDDIHLQFPGTGAPVTGQPLLLTITNGTFNTPGGPTTIGATTDAGGNVLATIYVNGSGSGYVSVTVDTSVGVGQPGLGFYHQTTGPPGAQVVAGFPAPTALSAHQDLFGQPQPPAPQGTISVQKSGNDTAYYGIAGAVFEVEQGGSVLATLTTDASGATATTPPLPVGTYTVHEATPPPGYQAAPDEAALVNANTNTVAQFTGANGDLISPATATIHKTDAQGGAPLAGAVFDVRYSTADDGVYDQDLGTCTTDGSGQCAPPSNDGTALLPGRYLFTELSAPPGYYLDPSTATQSVVLTPGEAGSVSFSDLQLGSLQLDKAGNDTSYYPVAGAVFTVSGPAPSPTVVGTLTVGASGVTNTLLGLVPGVYTVTETAVPNGYQPVAPVSVTVATGHAVTTVDVLDPVQPATVAIRKVDAERQAPLAGAVFDVRYSTTGNGTYDIDLGTCTTDAAGRCAPPGNDGSDLLPGSYLVTETAAPPGYVVDPSSTSQVVVLAPGENGTVTFADHQLVAASFAKVATGNVNPAEVVYAGAVIEVRAGSPSGNPVASCTTDAGGACTTEASLIAGSTYCWLEVAAPPGLEGGASGCFSADDAQAAQPITVTDPGLFVPLQARKVDAAAPSVTLSGALLYLYRVDHGQGPPAPAPPPGAPTEAGQTWVASATTGASGTADFGLQFPGFAYCVLEISAPAHYLPDPEEVCSPVVSGSADEAPAPVVVTVPDAERTVSLEAHKFNSATPDTGIPGAVYDLYVEGVAPPSGVPSPTPPDAASEPGDTWYARGTSDTGGRLVFTVPAGFAWCLREVSAPLDYALDPSLHCSEVIDESTAPAQAVIALPEQPAIVHLTASKFNATRPDTVIPGATYELLAVAPGPAASPPPAPAGVDVPSGYRYWAQGTSDQQGFLSFAVPAGSAWCLHEISAPVGYQPDPGYHCTAVLTTETPARAMTIALPEQPTSPPMLAFTGGPGPSVVGAGLVLLLGGGTLVGASRREKVARR